MTCTDINAQPEGRVNKLYSSAPPMPKERPLWQGAVLVGRAVAMAFPMAGAALLTVLVIDTLILSSWLAYAKA
ncbi:hypothetical protein [Sulfitobacter algicola]|uniref:hypothetical protein n=1 Tax=Parasulfitobacter algicola TaxID=2614809 RepID=UPI001C2DC1D6